MIKVTHCWYLEDDVVRLGEAHDENDVDGTKLDQVVGQHSVDHRHERTREFKASTEKNVWHNNMRL